MQNKSNETRIKEGRCRGYGKDYKPFYTANERSSRGTSSLIWDPIDKRMVSVLSNVERNFFYHLRWDDSIVSIREQYLLDIDAVNRALNNLGRRAVPKDRCYTTDFLVDCIDGTEHAYSVKWDREVFNPDSIRYVGRPRAYEKMKKRQEMEAEYWRLKDVPFSIVTGDDFDQFEAENISFILGFYGEDYIVTGEQKLLYLIAHKAIAVPLNEDRLNPHNLLAAFPYNIDDAYEAFRETEKEGKPFEICSFE